MNRKNINKVEQLNLILLINLKYEKEINAKKISKWRKI
jgi:hypothetical protein